MKRISLILFITTIFLIATNAHKFGDSLNIKVNKVSPFTNPTSAYKFYALPFCIPSKASSEQPSFGERLTGNARIDSVYKIQFGVDVHQSTVCSVELTERQIKNLRGAIKNNFVFEMFIDDISVGNAVGYNKNDRNFLATHYNFDIFFNKKQGKIIRASVDFDENRHVIDITDGEARHVAYTYSVNWIETEITTPTIPTGVDTFFANESHTASYVNGVVLSISTLAILFTILQKAQGADSNFLPEMESERRDTDSAWKTLRADVLNPPSFINLLSASIGVGVQLTFTIIIVTILGEYGFFYYNKGSLLIASMLSYAATSLFAGLISGSLFRYLGGKYWASNIVLTVLLFAGPVLVTTIVISLLAWKNSLSIALPATVIAIILCAWSLGVVPLTAFGSIFGRTKVKDISEGAPKTLHHEVGFDYYKSSLVMILLAGLFSFSVLHSELYYVFSALWKRKVFTSYSSLLIVLIMAINVSAAISTIFTFFQLNKKDSRWWWKSFLYGGSSGVFVFLYAVYFYVRMTNLSGFIQLVSYFACSALIAFAASLVLGTAGFLASSAFIKHIYERRKVD